MRKFISALMFSSVFAGTVLAHEGHGMTGTHWHASDVLGFVVAAVLAGLVLWHFRK